MNWKILLAIIGIVLGVLALAGLWIPATVALGLGVIAVGIAIIVP